MVHYNKDSISPKDSKKEKKGENKNKKKPKYLKAQTIHHITPSSRGGSDDDFNKAKIIEWHHQKYHELFGNMTPHEILAWLETYFFDGQTEWIDSYSFNREIFLSKFNK